MLSFTRGWVMALHPRGRKDFGETPPWPSLPHGQDPHRIFSFQEAAVSFVPEQRQGSDYGDRIRVLRRDWAEGRLTEDALLESLSRRLRLEIVHLDQTPPLDYLQEIFDPDFLLRNQILPYQIERDHLVFATARPEDFLSLIPEITAALSRRANPLAKLRTNAPVLRISVRPVIASRDAIHDYLAERHRPRLTRAMAQRVSPDESCRTWQVNRRRFYLTGFAIAALALLTLLWPGHVMLAITGWAVLTLLCAVALKGSALLASVLNPPSAPPAIPPPGTALPVISVLAPLFRERRIAEQLIRRLERLDYPKENLDVVLVLEETDQVTRDVVAAQQLPNWMRVVIVPDGFPRTKPRAMNYALDFCRGEVIGIYDAEDAPDPDQLRRVAAHFNDAPPEVACLQGALDFYNPTQNWLSRCFTAEYNSWFRVVLPGLTRLGFAIPLGGTTVFLRRAPLEAMGAWDAHNVTEDADLGYRLVRHGYRTEILQSTTGEEANCHGLPWVKQRSRWLKGYMVTYLVHMRRPLESLRQMGAWRFLGFQAHFISALSQFMLAPLLWSLWLLMLGLPHPMEDLVPRALLLTCTSFFILSEFLNFALGVIGLQRSGHRGLWPWVPSLHFYYPLGCLACYKALYEMIVCPFYWDKTQHGISAGNGKLPVAPPAQADQPRKAA